MNETKTLFSYEIADRKASGIPVIVVAGGSSSRMGQNKLLMNIGGVPVLVRTLKAFQKCGEISNIILVASKETVLEYQKLCDDYMLTKVTDITEGGQNRQESVLNGIKRLKTGETKVLIHDGARPLVSEAVVGRVIDGLCNYPAVVPVVKVKDTIKQIDQKSMVIKTVKRDDLVQVQTPQGVEVEKYICALEGKDLSLFTDDVSILESVGADVLAVEGDYKNIKITTPEDVIIAEAFLKEEFCE